MKIKVLIVLMFAVVLTSAANVHAAVGDMGFFGGISEGRRLPKTTEILLSRSTKSRGTNRTSFIYKEMLFISGPAVEFEGIMEVSSNGSVTETENVGTYTETYVVRNSATTAADVSIARNITFNVNWRREGKQIIKDYSVRTWTEVLTTPEGAFTIDNSQSYFGVSIIEDHTAGVVYYRGDISQHAVYTSNEGGEEAVATNADVSGSFYGYECAWSSTQTHRLDVSIDNPAWQMQYQVRPSVSVLKSMQYTQNEPTAISFAGNYKEVLENTSGLKYNIYVMPIPFFDQPDSGGATVVSMNDFEQLIAPDVSYLKGHFAEEDIRKLFSMQVLEGDAKFYQPDQAITRAQYITALVKAVKLPIEELQPTTRTTRRTQTTNITFPDVTSDRPDYQYIMAAYKAGLAAGRSDGRFYSDSPIERQEALTILLRALGLENLGLDPTPVTVFTDDFKIANWAKRELYAAERIDLISGDEDGNIRPTEFISKAEAAALLNRLIDYMRSDLAADYTEHIVNYAN